MNQLTRIVVLAAAAGAVVCAQAYPTFDGGATSVTSPFVRGSGKLVSNSGPSMHSGSVLGLGMGPSQGFQLRLTAEPPRDAVPEPFTMALGAGALALAAARKRRKAKR